MKSIKTFIILVLLVVVAGCSNAPNTVVPDSYSDTVNSAQMPDISGNTDIQSTQGILGAYDLTLDPETKSVELTPKRFMAEGESYLVNGLAFFTINPCPNCLRYKAIEWKPDGISISFTVEHPFDKGNTSLPPTAKNRLDLDVFDMALVIHPLTLMPQNYSNLAVTAYNDVCMNQDGYTLALSGLLGNNSVLPYFLVIDDNQASTNTFNKFEMGSSADFQVDFQKVVSMTYELYLIMGYGISAKLATRLSPTYYNPEFNWKSPWKVKVQAPDDGKTVTIGHTWDSLDTTTTYTVEVFVYDWQIGATVDPTLADPSSVFAASEVAQISVEIPGMTSSTPSVLGNQSLGGTGAPNDPLRYEISFANEQGQAAGQYIGLVKVADNRAVGSVPPGGTRDFLVDNPDGYSQEFHGIPEFATYQTFPVNIVPGCDGYCWGKDWGSNDVESLNSIDVDNEGNVYVTGYFFNTVIFDPETSEVRSSHGNEDAFLLKYDSLGNLQWLKTWGGIGSDSCEDVEIGPLGEVFVVGYFQETVDFNPDGGGTKVSVGSEDAYLSKFDQQGNWIWTQVWGGPDSDWAWDVVYNAESALYVVGEFYSSCDFTPGGGGTKTSNGGADCYVSYFSDDGSWSWTQTWGGTQSEACFSVTSDSSGNAFITGIFNGTTDLDPNTGFTKTSNGQYDVFLTKFDKYNAWQWGKVWGGTGFDTGNCIDTDATGHVYVMGDYRNTVDFNPAGGGTKIANGGGPDCYLSKFDTNGIWWWTETWGGPSSEYGNSVFVGEDGYIYTGGEFSQTVDFNPSGGGTETSGGFTSDSFISVFDANGTWQWVETWGGSDNDEVFSVAVDNLGNAYAGGLYYDYTDLDPDDGDPRLGKGVEDCFVSRFRF
jgi:hypothetical protein